MPVSKIIHYCFVILHYGDVTDTMSAVGSVLALTKSVHKVSIIIVDNASPNGTGQEVKRHIENLQNVYFIQNKENLGFAKGNNVGFKFAKQELLADFIVLMNNDAIIKSDNICELVEDDFQKEKFAVLGPSIRTPLGHEQNPLRLGLLKGLRLDITMSYLLVDFVLTFLFVSPALHKIFNPIASTSRHRMEPINNVELHGSFLVFSPIYIERFDGLDERTFLYCEEEFLFARCHFNKLKTRFNPQIQIIHNEMENSNPSISKMRKKRLFRVRNCLKSLFAYRKALKDGSF
jgi:GT2 family glycosyltransferase